jgi:hypothetical protein
VEEMKHILSLGAGVQSSTLALMAAKGQLTPMPDCAIFADTQAEPASVYAWLNWLENQLPFPLYRVTAGNLESDELRIRTSGKTGKRYLKGSIPAFVLKDDGGRGLLGRKCTSDYKIVPIQRKVRELCGIKRGGRGVVLAKMWIGISTDEWHRMKPSRVDYIENVWPLLDKKISRKQCLLWMKAHGYPEPPRSACVFCPFHGDQEWRRLRDEEPQEWQRAIEFERKMQAAQREQEVLRSVPYLHQSLRPLDSVDIDTSPMDLQLDLFGDECEGLCGV